MLQRGDQLKGKLWRNLDQFQKVSLGATPDIAVSATLRQNQSSVR
jgi:hypothetical protein